MKMFFSLIFILISSTSIYSQIADGSKIYIIKNAYYIPGVKEKLIAIMYKGDGESVINREDSAYILWLALSNKYDYKIKYSITDQNYLVAFSLFSDSFKVDDRFLNQKVPLFTAIKLAELENAQSESIKSFFNNNGITGPDVQSLSLLDNSLMKQYIDDKAKTDLIFHDFASSSKELFLVNKISDTLKIWKYDIEHKDLQIVNNTSSSKPQKILPQLFYTYPWKLNGNFYTCYIKNQLL